MPDLTQTPLWTPTIAGEQRYPHVTIKDLALCEIQ